MTLSMREAPESPAPGAQGRASAGAENKGPITVKVKPSTIITDNRGRILSVAYKVNYPPGRVLGYVCPKNKALKFDTRADFAGSVEFWFDVIPPRSEDELQLPDLEVEIEPC